VTDAGISQQELESWLWGAADILRGPVDPGNFRDFIFPLLFLKRLSDTWDDEHARAVEAWGDQLTDEIARDFHKFDIPKGCHWEDLRRAPENHGVLIQEITQKIEQANPDRLAGIFGSTPWADPNRMPSERLVRLIDHFNRYVISPSRVPNDMLGAGYEYLLKSFSDENAVSAGQFFTPRAIIHLLIKILDPQPTDTIYDPACGSAGMLIESANAVQAAGKSIAQMRFYGQEVNQTSAAIGRMNLYIHDVDDAQIVRGDTLRDPKFVDDLGKLRTFDVVIANPPFSLKDWGQENWATDAHRRSEYGGVPPRNQGDMAWIQHMLASADADTGRVGVVMPHGVLFRSGAEARIRQHLIESDLLEAIIGLGNNLFYGTGIPACLMIFRRTRVTDSVGKVRIIDGSQRFQSGRNQNALTDDDVAALFEAYRDPQATPDKVRQATATVADIEANGWDLNIGRYLAQEDAETIDVAGALLAMRAAEAKTVIAQEAMHQRLRAAGYA
jgi:type I restriction enzyme M protein